MSPFTIIREVNRCAFTSYLSEIFHDRLHIFAGQQSLCFSHMQGGEQITTGHVVRPTNMEDILTHVLVNIRQYAIRLCFGEDVIDNGRGQSLLHSHPRNEPLTKAKNEFFYQFSPDAYALGINIVLYALSH